VNFLRLLDRFEKNICKNKALRQTLVGAGGIFIHKRGSGPKRRCFYAGQTQNAARRRRLKARGEPDPT